MSGVAGRSGRRRKPLETHLRNGTYRRDRHGPILTGDPAPERGAVPARLVSGLGKAGKVFAASIHEDYQLSNTEIVIVRLAATALDDVAAFRKKGDMKSAMTSHRLFLATMGRLGLPDASERGGM